MKLPMTSASISLLEKVLKALAGVFTIGSPLRLKEVFSSAGIPVACPKLFDQLIVARTCIAKYGLQAAGAVHVRDGGQGTLPAGPHGHDVQHVARRIMVHGVGQLEIDFCALGENRWSEGTIGFAKLDFGVDDVLHRRISRVGKNAAGSQSARAPLKASLKPANDLALLQAIHHLVDQAVVVFDLLVRDLLAIQKIPDFGRSIFLAPVGVVHAKSPGISQQHVVRPQRSSQCAAAISGRRLYEQLLEWRLPQDALVGNTVEAHAAGNAQPLHAGLFVNTSCQAQQNFLGDLLDARGDISVVLVEFAELVVVRRRRTEVRGKTRTPP